MTAAFFSQRQADQPPPLGRHEINILSRHKSCANYEITLILAILIINKDDHLAVPIILKHILNRANAMIVVGLAHY